MEDIHRLLFWYLFGMTDLDSHGRLQRLAGTVTISTIAAREEPSIGWTTFWKRIPDTWKSARLDGEKSTSCHAVTPHLWGDCSEE